MSLFTYNNVCIPYANNAQCLQESVFDESGTDWMLTRFDISITGVLNAKYLNIIAPALDGKTTSPADIMYYIRSQLLKPRRTMSYVFEGRELIPVGPGGAPIDAKNGPQPQHCLITQLTNTTFLISYRVIGHYWENNGDINSAAPTICPNEASNPVISNRWEETIELDDCQYTTRTRNGKFIIRSDNVQGQIADRFSPQMAIPAVPAGFNRISSRRTVSADGLGISYTIVDKEVFKQPPDPAFTAEGEYIESTTRYGAQRWGEVRVRLKGSKNTSQSKLIEVGLSVCAKKLFINGAQVNENLDGFAMLEFSSIKTNMYRNEVDVSMKALMAVNTKQGGEGKRVYGVPGYRFGVMTFTPLSDGVNYTPPYTNRGTAKWLLQAASYFNPNDVNNKLVGQQMSQGAQVGQEGVQLEGV